MVSSRTAETLCQKQNNPPPPNQTTTITNEQGPFDYLEFLPRLPCVARVTGILSLWHHGNRLLAGFSAPTVPHQTSVYSASSHNGGIETQGITSHRDHGNSLLAGFSAPTFLCIHSIKPVYTQPAATMVHLKPRAS